MESTSKLDYPSCLNSDGPRSMSDDLPKDSITGITSSGQITAQNLSIIIGNNNNPTFAPPLLNSPIQDGIHFNIQETVPSFAGRDEFLAKLHAEVGPQTVGSSERILSKLVVISGLPGVGKTQCVRKYIQKYKECYDHIIWINSESNSVARSCFLKLAEQTKIDAFVNKKPKEDLELIEEIIDSLTQRFLLAVYDNVDDTQAENGLDLIFPRRLKPNRKVPAVIVTSRSEKWNTLKIERLAGLNDTESFCWFKSALNIQDTQENRHLVQEIMKIYGGLPIFIQQVIKRLQDENELRKAISKDLYTVKEFLEDVGKSSSKLTKAGAMGVTQEGRSLFKEQFQRISTKKFGELALKCLDIMALLNPDHIPAKLLKHLVSDFTDAKFNVIPAWLQKAFLPKGQFKKVEKEPEFQVAEALKILLDFGLITNCGNFYQIHRVVQTMRLEDKFHKRQGSVFTREIKKIIASFTSYLITLVTNEEYAHEILGNGIRIYDQATAESGKKSFNDFASRLAQKLNDIGLYAEANRLNYKKLAVLSRTVGEDHPKSVATLYNIAITLEYQGLFTQAKEIFDVLLALQTTTLGEDHADTLKIKHQIAANFSEQGLYVQAKEIYDQVLAVQIRKFGEDHPDTITTKHNIAVNLNHQSLHLQAKDIYDELLRVQTRTLGGDHPETVILKQCIANNLNDLGMYAEAKEIYGDVLAARSRILGEDHPDTATTKYSIAKNLTRQGLYAQAKELYDEVLVVQTRTLGAEHHHTIRTMHCIAANLSDQGLHTQAMKVYEEMLAAQVRTLGKEHPQTAITMRSIAANFYQQGLYMKAREVHEEVLRMQLRTLGAVNPETLNSKHMEGILFKSSGRL